MESRDGEAEDRGSLASDADPMDQQIEPDLELATAAPNTIPGQVASEVTEAITKTAKQSISVSLPRKFRKREIVVEPIDIYLSPETLSPPLELRDRLDEAIVRTKQAIIAEDSEIWRHLGAPQEAKRDLSGVGLLDADDTYEAALQAASQGEMALPTWRAYLTVSGQESLFAPAAEGRVFRLNVGLVNATPRFTKAERQRALLEERALFDCALEIEMEGCELVPFEFQGAARDYRYDRLFPAIGSNCIALATDDSNRRLHTETVPLFEQAWYRTNERVIVSFGDLDDTPGKAPLDVLTAVAGEMRNYLREWDAYLNGDAMTELDPEQVKACRTDRDNFVAEIRGFDLGVESLRRDAKLLRAFRLMNRTFRENGELRNPPIRNWRLFQLVFMVIQMPALAVREHRPGDDAYSQALKQAHERVDVLWFPTGGGKTEAYLGLIATGLFYDRLRGKRRGVTAWMRFPLRMLSLQQLERLARVVARAEMIRSQEADLRDNDADPFSMGYYVGGGNTPNRIAERDLPTGNNADERWGKQLTLRTCPFCSGKVSIGFDRKLWRLSHVCTNSACFTHNSPSLRHMRGIIPLFIVDNEIYRYRPSVLVGTVDKLAVLGFQKHFSHLIAPVTKQCPAHGYVSFNKCTEANSGGPCQVTPRQYLDLGPEKDAFPSFLIQDELHLLKEELGTFNAHYEGFLQHFARKQDSLPAKILAATATIEAYEDRSFIFT